MGFKKEGLSRRMRSIATSHNFRRLWQAHYPFILILSAAACLSFTGLGNNRFWTDEAETGIIAKNFLKTGTLTGWDGRNLYTFRNGTLLYPNYEVRIPPLQILIAAGSFRLFGSSTRAGRLPFIIAGLLALLVFYAILDERFGRSGPFRWYALIFVAFSYSYLLTIRQCRYYSPSLLFTLLAYYYYVKILNRPRPRYFLLLLASLLLSFFSHYSICFAFLGGVIPVHFIFHFRKFTRKEWLWMAGIGCVFCAVIAPYWLHYQITYRPDLPDEPVANRFIHLLYTVRELDFICYLPFFMAALAIFSLVRYRNTSIIPATLYEWIFLVCFLCVTSALTTRQSVEWQGIQGGLIDIRYLIIFLPFCAGGIAFAVSVTHRAMGAAIAAFSIALLLCSNLLSFNINGNVPLRWPLPGYVYEILHPHISPYDTAVSYLKSHAARNDIVYATPEYNLNVLQFYLGDSLIMGSLLTRDSPLPVDRLRKAGYPAYKDEYYPDWIVSFAMDQSRADQLDFFSRGLLERHDTSGAAVA
jgi:4-amino-4-deoxy-L-arabinose transferase-like glycosyltransferase